MSRVGHLGARGRGGCLETTLELTCKLAERPPFAVPPLSNYTFLSFGVYVCQRYCAAMRYIIDETLTVTVGTRPFRGNFKDNGHVLRLDGTEVAIVEP